MKEILNIRIDERIMSEIKNYQLLIGLTSGFVPSKTAVIEKMLVLGLEQSAEPYQVWKNTPNQLSDDDNIEIQKLSEQIYGFTQFWLDGSLNNTDE